MVDEQQRTSRRLLPDEHSSFKAPAATSLAAELEESEQPSKRDEE
jgi:hypothetical protein